MGGNNIIEDALFWILLLYVDMYRFPAKLDKILRLRHPHEPLWEVWYENLYQHKNFPRSWAALLQEGTGDGLELEGKTIMVIVLWF